MLSQPSSARKCKARIRGGHNIDCQPGGHMSQSFPKHRQSLTPTGDVISQFFHGQQHPHTCPPQCNRRCKRPPPVKSNDSLRRRQAAPEYKAVSPGLIFQRGVAHAHQQQECLNRERDTPIYLSEPRLPLTKKAELTGNPTIYAVRPAVSDSPTNSVG